MFRRWRGSVQQHRPGGSLQVGFWCPSQGCQVFIMANNQHSQLQGFDPLDIFKYLWHPLSRHLAYTFMLGMALTLSPFPQSLFSFKFDPNQWYCGFLIGVFIFPGSRATQQWQAWPDKTSEGGGRRLMDKEGGAGAVEGRSKREDEMEKN